MCNSHSVEHFALSAFSDLVAVHGFRGPIIARDRTMTRITYVNTEVGIELELDWRDLAAFLLIVRLDGGKLPDGYYVANGKTCRKHLSRVIEEQKWQAPAGPRFDRSKRKPRTEHDLQQAISTYKKQLDACIQQLASPTSILFS
jgi:hypothetical protein